MDKALVIGLLLALLTPGIGFLMEGGSLGSFVSPTAALIVFGGTIGAAFASFPMETMKSVPALLRTAFNEKKLDYGHYVQQLVEFARLAQSLQPRELEAAAQERLEDPFLRQGVQMIASNWTVDSLQTYVGTELEAMERRHEKGAQLFEAMGGYSPTFGIIGTVMGLVNVLSHLDKPEELGHSIAVAFIATLFGVGASNIFYLPIASKLKRKSEEERHLRDMLVDGLFMIHAQTPPNRVLQALMAHVPPGERAAIRAEIDARRRARAAEPTA